MKLFMTAGEASGDVLGADILSGIADEAVQITGVGGDMMRAQGLQSLFPMTDLSVMGLSEVVPKIPFLLRRIKMTADAIIAQQPDIVITIDSPDFSFRVVRRARAKCPNTKFYHLVAPTVWAWREKRAAKVAKLYDRLYCLLPFEPKYFENYGLDTRFIGHPIINKTAHLLGKKRDKDAFLVLFGSRIGEVERLGPVFVDFMRQYHHKNPNIRFLIPCFDHLRSKIEGMTADLPVTFIDPDLRYDSFATASCAVAASGTVGLELAVMGCPHIVAYKVAPLTYRLVKAMIRTPYVHLANIILNQRVVPELLQDQCTPEALYHAISTLDHEQADKLAQVRDELTTADGFSWRQELGL